jgi:hypothetical protein
MSIFREWTASIHKNGGVQQSRESEVRLCAQSMSEGRAEWDQIERHLWNFACVVHIKSPAKADELYHDMRDEVWSIFEHNSVMAEQRIRDTIRQMMMARKPKAEVILAAYRAAGRAIWPQEIEDIVVHEAKSIRRSDHV